MEERNLSNAETWASRHRLGGEGTYRTEASMGMIRAALNEYLGAKQ